MSKTANGVVQELGVHQNSNGLSSFSPLKQATNWAIHHFGRTKTQVNMAHMTKVLMPVNTHQCTPCINYASISSFTTCLAVAKCGEMFFRHHPSMGKIIFQDILGYFGWYLKSLNPASDYFYHLNDSLAPVISRPSLQLLAPPAACARTKRAAELVEDTWRSLDFSRKISTIHFPSKRLSNRPVEAPKFGPCATSQVGVNCRSRTEPRWLTSMALVSGGEGSGHPIVHFYPSSNRRE